MKSSILCDLEVVKRVQMVKWQGLTAQNLETSFSISRFPNPPTMMETSGSLRFKDLVLFPVIVFNGWCEHDTV